MIDLKTVTLALNSFYNGSPKFEIKNNTTMSYFWRIEKNKEGFKVVAQNNGVNQKDYVLAENANNLKEIIEAIEKDA